MIELIRIDENGLQVHSWPPDIGNAAVMWEQLYAEMMGWA